MDAQRDAAAAAQLPQHAAQQQRRRGGSKLALSRQQAAAAGVGAGEGDAGSAVALAEALALAGKWVLASQYEASASGGIELLDRAARLALEAGGGGGALPVNVGWEALAASQVRHWAWLEARW